MIVAEDAVRTSIYTAKSFVLISNTAVYLINSGAFIATHTSQASAYSSILLQLRGMLH